MAKLEREVFVYKNLLGKIDIKTPKCYYANSRLTCQYHLLFEDLSHATVDDTTIDKWFLSEFRDADLQKSIAVMAKMHSTHWNDREILKMDFFCTFTEREVAGGYFFGKLILKKAWDTLNRRNLWPQGWTFETLEEIFYFYPFIFKFINTQPFTAVHSDFRIGNILWETDTKNGGRNPYIIDWQTPRIHHGVADLNYHLSMDLPPDFRKEREVEYIKYYLEKLEEYGVPKDQLDFDKIMTIYRVSSLLNLIFFVFALGVVDPEGEEKERQFGTWTRRHSLGIVNTNAIELGRDLMNGKIWTDYPIFTPTQPFC
jgi:hypothetical protein